MKKALIIICGILALTGCHDNLTPVEMVNVFNGTDFSGNTYPGATVPFGAVQLSPDTDPFRASGYYYANDSIVGFSHTHLSGTGCPDLGDWLVTPALADDVKKLAFSHKKEEAHPGYYKVTFPVGITAELTATEHVGVHRYTFNGNGVRKIQVNGNYGIGDWMHILSVKLTADGKQGFTGEHRTTAWADDRDNYVSAVFSVPYEKAEEVGEGTVLFTFPDSVNEVTLYAGISGVSIDGAEKNLVETEDKTFDEIHERAIEQWAKTLGTIEVEGGPEDIFYTYLYRTYVTPNMIDDVDGAYRTQAGNNCKVEEGHHFYSTLSIWDIFRSWSPLQTLINPTLLGDIINSMLDEFDCRNELAVWPLASDETFCMIGYHSVSMIADAWLHGIRNFDGERALKAMIVSSNKSAANSSEVYNQYGFVPADLTFESVSKTLEFAYDDWCIARMAESLGHADIAAEYDRRAVRYRALFDPITGFMRGKNMDGSWKVPFEPTKISREYTESTPWQYRFFMPHDVAGMELLMGGREQMLAALDSLFTYSPEGFTSVDPGMGGMVGQYTQGNEPGHHLAWLYNWMGAPSKSQEMVRKLLKETYSKEPGGICGNEDCGQMGAWYVLASLGLHPVCPGSGQFLMSAPLFKKSVIHLGNGKTLTILADHPERTYISSVTLNGESIDQHFLTYEQIMEGGELSFSLSSKPDHSRDALPAPYSLTQKAFVSQPAIDGNLEMFDPSAEVTLTTRTADAKIYYTIDGSEPTEASTLYEKPFSVTESCRIRARAFKDGMEPSLEVYREAHKLFFRPGIDSAGMKPGVRYSYHQGIFQLVGQIEKAKATEVGVMTEPSIEKAADEDHYGYVFTGFIDVPEDGIWYFSTTSDDGSALYVEDLCVVNNDGSHSELTVKGPIPLKKGLHPFRLLFFEDYEGQLLKWGWKAPSAEEFTDIPADKLFYK